MLLIQKIISWLIKNPIVIVGILLFLAIGYIKILTSEVTIQKNAKVLAQNNFTALSKGTTVWQTRAGNYAAEVQEEQLTIDQIKDSKNKQVNSLLKYIDNLDIKIKDVSTLASNYASIIANFRVRVIHDTIVNGITYHEWERYTGTNLQVTRHLLKLDSAEYDYKYHVRLYYYIVNGKDGKWKFKNIFTPRPITNKLYITSDDKKFKVDSLQLIKKVK